METRQIGQTTDVNGKRNGPAESAARPIETFKAATLSAVIIMINMVTLRQIHEDNHTCSLRIGLFIN